MSKIISRSEQARIQHIDSIFDIILAHDAIFKRTIQDLSGYSWGTVSTTVNLLLEQQFIKETLPKEFSAGRPPKLYQINSDRLIFIGVDINIESLQIVSIDARQTVLFSETIIIPVFEQHFIIQLVIDVLRKFIDVHYPNPGNVLGIGVALPFNKDKNKHMVLLPSYIKGWTLDNLKNTLETEFNLPVIISHTANCLALAEINRQESISKDTTAVFVSIDYDIFASVLAGNVSMGNNFTISSSFGHTFVESNPETCSCGKIGCLQAICSIHGLASAYQKRILNEQLDVAYKFDSNLAICKRLFHAADQNNQEALELFHMAGKSLGISLSHLANILNPDIIILGGSFMQFSRHFYDTAMKYAIQSTAPHVTLNIHPSMSNSYGAAIGAAIYVIHQKPWVKYFLAM